MNGIIVLGTASDTGKSFIVTALCRLFANEGYKVAPFKSQNMSNNSYVTLDGKEIGRAQGIQAEAAKTEATQWMNPILLKPRSDMHSEVVLFGQAIQTYSGRDYRESFYTQGIEAIQASLKKLNELYDVIIMEGAGSPVEVNLKPRELVNMKVAELADVPALLVADIDRGGVFASIVGTIELLTESERKRIKGLIINKFRGDIGLFEDGKAWLEKRTGIPVLGVLPYIDGHRIEGEDSLSLKDRFSASGKAGIDIVVVKLPFLSNYTDIEPFLYEKDVSVRWITEPDQIGQPDAIIIPGTKSTIHDLHFLRKSGLDAVIKAYDKSGGRIVGICGGYQMIGETLMDPEGTDTGKAGSSEKGLAIIPGHTTFQKSKITVRTRGRVFTEESALMEGYEIHLGKTSISDHDYIPFLQLEDGRVDGYCGENGRIIGTYLHHVFHNDRWRNQWLNRIRIEKQLPLLDAVDVGSVKNESYDQLADSIEPHLDWGQLKEIIFQRGKHT
ncbi:cobyric acid synthase [Peribacillus saganii]|uniref:Cobyric acid synthase n=1 Tax=Peribacillus saganii TaxID=2303992 RepID=A0A372LT93_9BACI|nr:cobyric acid synthase [Peribacillus saganii]RFU71409.1 cobyric acid synthase [Peribacillus saganii]